MDNIDIYPSYLDNTKFKYIKLDNKYIASLVVLDYPKESGFLEIIDSIPKDESFNMSIYIQKQNTSEILKKLTYHISSSGTEIKTANENQIDIDVLDKVKKDAKELRRQIQINNEEIYYINIFITFFNNDTNQILNILKNFQSKLYSKQIMSNITNFRHLDSYVLTLPIINTENNNLKTSYRNITTSSLSNIFPFYTKTVFDKKGVIFGYTLNENRICNIDIFDSKYLNSNMCIFGSSGSGKSFFAKTLILRNYITNKNQYIFDPEGEYLNIIKKVEGEYISFFYKSTEKCINILDIDCFDIFENKENFLINKINEITSFLIKICQIENEKYIIEIKNSIEKAYNEKGITNNINTLYIDMEEEKIYINKKIKDKKYFPTLIDVLNNIKNKQLRKVIEDNIINKYPCITNHTNTNIYSKLFLFDLSRVNIKHSAIFIDYYIDKLENMLKINRIKNESKNTIIYIDEIWKYIRLKGDCNLAEKIFMMFKTIRKHKASIVTITQDISDFFSFEDGNYGKSILNNCSFKMFFKLDFIDKKTIEKLNVLSEKDLEKISFYNKGQALLLFKNNITTLNIKSNNYEKELIEEESN